MMPNYDGMELRELRSIYRERIEQLKGGSDKQVYEETVKMPRGKSKLVLAITGMDIRLAMPEVLRRAGGQNDEVISMGRKV